MAHSAGINKRHTKIGFVAQGHCTIEQATSRPKMPDGVSLLVVFEERMAYRVMA